MSSEMLAYGAGVILSLFIAYFPKVNEWFAALAPREKRLVNLGLMILAGGAAFGVTCAGLGASLPAGWVLTCDQAGATELVTAIVRAAIANQATFMMVQAPSKIRAISNAAKAANPPPA